MMIVGVGSERKERIVNQGRVDHRGENQQQ